jgi:hypothetical protein
MVQEINVNIRKIDTSKCCKPGTFEHQIPMLIMGRVRYIDYCIADIVAALNAAGINTIASCCGHGMDDGSILLDDRYDNREIIIKWNKSETINKNDREIDCDYLTADCIINQRDCFNCNKNKK